VRRALKWAAVLLGSALLVAGGGLLYLWIVIPDVGPAPNIIVDRAPPRLARGRYLVENVAACLDCHSQRDWTLFGAPRIRGTDGHGGDRFEGAFGVIYAPNITPAGIGDWTDGEIYRAVTSGLDREDRPLFPLMPYADFGRMDTDDVYAMVAYLRTLKPIEATVAEPALSFAVSLYVRTLPRPAAPQRRPLPDAELFHGRYLANAGLCDLCHTPRAHGTPISEKRLAGGFALPVPGGGWVRSTNITPDEETGIGRWTRAGFVARFKRFAGPGAVRRKLADGEPNTVMPWFAYAGMTEADLGAIYAYLRTVRPVKNAVAPFGEDG